MIREKLVEEFFKILERSGRDWHRVRWAIRGLETEIQRSVSSGEDWSEEMKEYMEWRICEALAMARRAAVEREEFEWAHEVTIRLEELGWTEEDEKESIKKLTEEDV